MGGALDRKAYPLFFWRGGELQSRAMAWAPLRHSVWDLWAVVNKVALEQVLLRKFGLFVILFPLILDFHHHLNITVIRRTNGRGLGTFEKRMLFGILERSESKSTFPLFLHRLQREKLYGWVKGTFLDVRKSKKLHSFESNTLQFSWKSLVEKRSIGRQKKREKTLAWILEGYVLKIESRWH